MSVLHWKGNNQNILVFLDMKAKMILMFFLYIQNKFKLGYYLI
jgi:hypothetical protein